ncbi:MAG: MFS transporter [Legionellaceae bacterium]|nr:MFS transporter [Legionellaceae bacterium]
MLKETQFTIKGFIVWSVCVLFFLYEFFLRVSLGSFQHPLMLDLHLSAFEYSLLSSTLFFVVYGVMQIPVGLLIDKIGLKKSLTIGAGICALSSFAFAYSPTFEFAVISRIMMGLGASFGFLSMLVSVNDWMPHRHNAFFIGLSQFIGTMGPMFGAGPLESFTTSAHIQWQWIFKALGFIGLAIFILIIIFVEDRHEQSQKYSMLRRPENTKRSLLKLFSRAQAWYIGLFTASVYLIIEYLSENEGRVFIGLKGFSDNFSSYMITLSWLGYAIGCPLLGFISDYTQRRKPVLVASALMSVSSMLLIIFSNTKYGMVLGFFMLGIAASGQSVGFAIISEQFKKQFIGIGLALNNAMIMILSAINAPLIGWIIDRSRGDANFGLHTYQMTFLILLFIAVIAVICSVFFIKETFCKSAVDFSVLDSSKRSS